MMTFEKVLEVFEDYLAEDTNCEVVLTKHGYTVMQWIKIPRVGMVLNTAKLPKIYEMNFSAPIT